MSEARHYDVIGTGAGGGTLAHRPAPGGKRVLMLERGDHLPRERDNRERDNRERDNRERDNWDSTAVFVRGKNHAPEYWYDRHGPRGPHRAAHERPVRP
ncbi:hypothetical protein [Streptomyces sp. DSM 15324]|uniref:hypothetical protein n=1 Tax=Streptomyces sp. DSM 15324 TaxID=1739111 RepID=UPI00074AC0B4|nr:hypothetical protein [Streptomyces sp. DSM 15324]KUO10816.1 hypothetical protein AQJ58_17960 [Streptomyces sp. DSM 15324]